MPSKSVYNCCVIELCVNVNDLFVYIGAFVIGLGQISLKKIPKLQYPQNFLQYLRALTTSLHMLKERDTAAQLNVALSTHNLLAVIKNQCKIQKN